MEKRSLEKKRQLLLAALHAANECERLGGFTAEHLPAIMAATALIPPPVAKKPLEWKEATKAGHAPGTWPHFVAHMEDIASKGVTIRSRRKRIGEINAALKSCGDKKEEKQLVDERWRLQNYCVFLETLLNNVIVAISTEITAVERLLEQAKKQAKQKPKADIAPKNMSSKKSGKVTPELLDTSFKELCRGNTRDIERRHQAARRLIEIVLKQRGSDEYSKEERDAIETRLRSIVKFTIMLEEPNASQEELERWVGNWIANVLHDLGITVPEEKAAKVHPLDALKQLGLETKLQPDQLYDAMQAAIKHLLEIGMETYDAVNDVDRLYEEVLQASKEKFAYTEKEIAAIEDARTASAVDLFPDEDTAEEREEGPLFEEIKDPPTSPPQAAASGFTNDALARQLEHIVTGVKKGTITVTSKA